MPKRQPSLGRDPVQYVRNYEQSVKRTWLLCTKFHELIRLPHPSVSICSHILPIVPMLYPRALDVPQVLFQEVANAAFGVPNVHEADSLCSKQLYIVQWLALESGGRWSQEATTFLRLLAHTKARAARDILRQAVEAALLSRWSAILTHAAQHAFAASLLDLDCAGASFSLRSPRPTPAHQSCPSPPLTSRDLDLAGFPCTSGAAGVKMALPGD